MALALDPLRARLATLRPGEGTAAAAEAGIVAASLPAPAEGAPLRRWCWPALTGRLTELSSATGAGTLTWALRLAAEAQGAGRCVAWVTTAAGAFFPPDAEANGVALAALAVVRVPDAAAVGRAAERLARSGGFGLVVLDLAAAGPRAMLAQALQGRLVQHALRHGTAVLCLTEKPERTPSLGSLVSLRAVASRARCGPQAAPDAGTAPAPFRCALHAVKDKRGGPGWDAEEACHGPPGLR